MSDDVLLKVEGLRVHFPVRSGLFAARSWVRAVDGVSFELRAGEALGIVGESGCGKSTLARAILQLVRPNAGRVVWLGQSLEAASAQALSALRRDLQIVFQDPLASLNPRMTIGEIVAEPLRVHRPGHDRAARAQAVAAMLERVGLTPQLSDRYPHELSGGQCQRVGIARAMILGPKLLVCDEPVSALDVSIQAQIVALLQDLKRETGLSILFVSHNLAVVRRLCERVLVMYLGRMMELAPTESLYGSPLHPYTRGLLEAVPIPDPDLQPARIRRTLEGEPPSPTAPLRGCAFQSRCAHAIARCAVEAPGWDNVDGHRRVACHRWRELAPRE